MGSFGILVLGLAIVVALLMTYSWEGISRARRLESLSDLDGKVFRTRQLLRVRYGEVQTALVTMDDPSARLEQIHRELESISESTASAVSRRGVPAAVGHLRTLQDKVQRSREGRRCSSNACIRSRTSFGPLAVQATMPRPCDSPMICEALLARSASSA